MYSYKNDGEKFVFWKDGKTLKTPMDHPVLTKYKNIADRLLNDLQLYGEDPSDPISIVAFHCAMIDFFKVKPRGELEHSIAIGLERENDWTLERNAVDPNLMMEWWGIFGRYPKQAKDGLKWLKTLNNLQLCAVCVIGRSMESVNIPFIVATQLKPEDEDEFIEFIDMVYPYIGFDV